VSTVVASADEHARRGGDNERTAVRREPESAELLTLADLPELATRCRDGHAAVYDQRCALGLSVADLAGRAGMTADEIECIEEGGTEPTIALLRRLDADVHLTAGHDLGSV
jgi:ribosome-binding protein aMBF1 (putative translation factor)